MAMLNKTGRKIAVAALVILTVFVALILVAITREANQYYRALQQTDRDLEQLFKPIGDFRANGGAAIGCYNTPFVRQLPTLGPNASRTDVEKVKAVQEYLNAAKELASELDRQMPRVERATVGLPLMPDAVGALPWMRDKYTALREQVVHRVTWAKSELADHSCGTR